MIDIGINLTNQRFHKDLEEVIDNAKLAGVKALIVTGTSIEESQQAIELCLQHPQYLYCTAGIHPHDAKTFDGNSLSQLRSLANNKQAKAIGECGLDFNRNFSTAAEQEIAFVQQLELAVELQLPVFMHERDANERFIELLTPYIKQLPNAVLHCFTGSQSDLEHCLALDLHIGITGWICDERRGGALREAARYLPLDQVLLETDAPYLTPRDMKPKPKGGRNEPAFLPHVAHAVASCMGCDFVTLAAASTHNARVLFGLEAP